MIKVSLRSVLVLAMAFSSAVAPPVLAEGLSERAISACTDNGGKIQDDMCRLRDGRVCQAMKYARTGECYNEYDELVNADGSTSSSGY